MRPLSPLELQPPRIPCGHLPADRSQLFSVTGPKFGEPAGRAAGRQVESVGPEQLPAAVPCPKTPSSAASHERYRATFSPQTPENTGLPKLSPRKSPPPSQLSALMSADRRTWPQRRLARSPLEKSNGCKPATPAPPIDQSHTEVPQDSSFAAPKHQFFRSIRSFRHTAAPHFRHTAVSATPPFEAPATPQYRFSPFRRTALRHTAAPHKKVPRQRGDPPG
jgi:hypothetical protein